MKNKKSISELVYEMVKKDETAYESIRRGFMNYSSYAQIIKPEIDKQLNEKTKLNTITASLIRYYDSIKDESPIKVNIPLEKLAIKTPLVDITYKKSLFDYGVLDRVRNKLDLTTDFFAITQGDSQISIVIGAESANLFRNFLKIEPLKEIHDLAAIVCPFHSKYYDQVNIIYSITSKLAIERIEIVEILSTYTEIVYIVRNKDIDKALEALKTSLG